MSQNYRKNASEKVYDQPKSVWQRSFYLLLSQGHSKGGHFTAGAEHFFRASLVLFLSRQWRILAACSPFKIYFNLILPAQQNHLSRELTLLIFSFVCPLLGMRQEDTAEIEAQIKAEVILAAIKGRQTQTRDGVMSEAEDTSSTPADRDRTTRPNL